MQIQPTMGMGLSAKVSVEKVLKMCNKKINYLESETMFQVRLQINLDIARVPGMEPFSRYSLPAVSSSFFWWVGDREFELFFRGPSCLAVVWFGSTPARLPPPYPCSNLSFFLSLHGCRQSSLLTGEWGGGGRLKGGGRAESYDHKKALPLYKTFNLLWVGEV